MGAAISMVAIEENFEGENLHKFRGVLSTNDERFLYKILGTLYLPTYYSLHSILQKFSPRNSHLSPINPQKFSLKIFLLYSIAHH